jgi:polyphosphate kinase 2 (PPK2 family)
MAAYQEAIRETATSSAPWYVIPANRKWYRDWAILKLLIATLEEMHLRPRKPDFDPRTIRIR